MSSRDGRALPKAIVFWTASLLALSIALGGGTKAGFLADVVLQMLAVPLLLGALWSLRWRDLGALGRGALMIAAAMVAMALLQIVPLPSTWQPIAPDAVALPPETPQPPAHARAAKPISTSLHATALALLAGLPALAVFLATCRLASGARRHVTLTLMAVGFASAILGLMQVAQGPASPLRFFAITNATEPVGFFANRNHFAALLYVLLLLGAAWAMEALQRVTAARADRRFDADIVLPALLGLMLIALLIAVQAFARSRAGLALTMLALLGVLALAGGERGPARRTFSRVVLAGSLAGVVIAIQFALYRIVDRMGGDALADARIPFAQNTIDAARAYSPFGSGLGTFVDVYGAFERPRDVFLDVYANRAHNDFLEVWLEAGIPGAVLFLAFASWFMFAVIGAWGRRPAGQSSGDRRLARAASLIVLLLLLHSLVDYPLRTNALLTVFAFACALLVPPPIAGPPPRFEGAAERAPRVAPAPPSSAPPMHAPAGSPWRNDVAWPAAWRRPAGAQSPEQNIAQKAPKRAP